MHWIVFWPRVKTALPYLLTLAFTAFVGCVTGRHEMWRDEIQAWLLARDSATPLQLLHNIRYEGHPGLWHLLLWPLTWLTTDPWLMPVLHVALAGLSALLVFRYSPFSWVVKILLCFGYFFAYEYAAIARNYAISVTLFFTVCVLFEQRWRNFPALAAALFLLCHTNIFALLLVGVLAVTLSIEFAVAYAGRYRQAERCLGRFLVGLGIIAAGLSTGIHQISPPSDTGFARGWKWEWRDGTADTAGKIVIKAYLPVPVKQLNFWNTNRFLDRPRTGPAPSLLPQTSQFGVGLALLVFGSLFFLKRPWLLVPYWLGNLALLTFYLVKYNSGIRHAGFLYVWFIVMLWMSFAYRPWTLPVRWAECLPSFWDRHRLKVLVPLLVVHLWGAAVAISVDWREPFSQAKATAQWLKAEYPDLARFVVVGDNSPAVSAVVGYLGLPRIYYPDRAEFGSYLIWDEQWSRHAGRSIDQQVEDLVKNTGQDALLILNYELGNPVSAGKATLLRQFPGASRDDECYWIYRWPALTTGSS